MRRTENEIMPSPSYARNLAQSAMHMASDPAVKKLAEAVMALCQACQDIEEQAKKAYDEARRRG